jgi:fatty acid desaturase
MWRMARKLGFAAALKSLHRPNIWRSLAAAIGDWVAIFAAFALVVKFGFLAAPLAIIIIGNRQRALGNLLHDAAHGSFGQHRRLADFIAHWILFLPLWNVMQIYRRDHFSHHRQLGVPGEDGDLIHREEDLTQPWFGLFLLHTIDMRNWLGSIFAHLPRAGWRETGMMLLLWSGLLIALACLINPAAALEFLALWLIARATVFHLITMFREISDHVGLRPGTLMGFCRNNTSGGIFTVLFHPHNNGYHLVHHLNPGMPFHALPQAHRLLLAWPEYAASTHCDTYAALVRSWVRPVESTSFCEQKEAKKLLFVWANGVFTSTLQIKRSFLVLFFKKELTY